MTYRTALPPDPEQMNDKRAAWASLAVRAFQVATGTDDEDVLGDLLADLMHWADRHDYDFDAAFDRGRLHYEAETAASDVTSERFDAYEISPCRRYEEPDRPGLFYFEPCEPQAADVWTLYGHIPGQGAEAIGDFATQEQAEEICPHHRATLPFLPPTERRMTMSQLLDFNPQINPAYAARIAGKAEPAFARLPQAPVNASPVPHLTSLYHFHRAGEYGDRSYPGNCGGNLIKDLLLYFKPRQVCDPMAGSGTCRDVCQELGLPCMSCDIHDGFDACDPKGFSATETFDFIWSHPAYWRQKLYADDPRDLSRSPTLEHFLQRYGQFIRNCARALKPGGKLAVLMGDYSDREAGFVPLTWHTKRLAFEAGLRQCCTDIIRFSHGASSSRKVYRSSFIPGLHDVCMIFEKRS